jgi:hypothetical protein
VLSLIFGSEPRENNLSVGIEERYFETVFLAAELLCGAEKYGECVRETRLSWSGFFMVKEATIGVDKVEAIREIKILQQLNSDYVMLLKILDIYQMDSNINMAFSFMRG